ncbi:hypothetical protein D910_09472 [Dendroctonus ponderosae]|uniref:Uncharacterized protein n=1 Tax=Dendroctonus ponderosae TaxID=77166 RepID=U4UGJ6_DENPD|nr:hypothetical protein D910_09472 [Dendroctonus ponderosae]
MRHSVLRAEHVSRTCADQSWTPPPHQPHLFVHFN